MPKSIVDVICLGDSNAAGIGNPERVSWVGGFRNHFYSLHTRPRELSTYGFYDLSVPGETPERLRERLFPYVGAAAVDGAELLSPELQARARKPDKTLITVSLGGAQAGMDFQGRKIMDLEGFAADMRSLAQGLFRYGDIMYVGIPTPNVRVLAAPRLKPSADPIKDLDTLTLLGTAVVGKYEMTAISAIEEVRPDSRRFMPVPLLVDSYEDFTGDAPTYSVAPDNIHPSAQGHAWVLGRVIDAFNEMSGLPA